MSYFEHYKHINDLSDFGRKRYWGAYKAIYSRHLPNNKKAKILDFGSGAGLFMEWLCKDLLYEDVTGVDTDKGQVDFAKNMGLNVIWTDDPISWMKTQDKYFDLIVMKDVIEHIPSESLIDTVKEIYSHLTVGGQLLLSTPNANSNFASRMRYIDITHQTSYTEHSLHHVLVLAGFDAGNIQIYPEEVWRASSALGYLRLIIKLIFRGIQRLSALAEFGYQGINMPLSLNLLAICKRGAHENIYDN